MDTDLNSVPVPESLACDLVGLSVDRALMTMGGTDEHHFEDVRDSLNEATSHLALLGRAELLNVCESLVDIAVAFGVELADHRSPKAVFDVLRLRSQGAAQADADWLSGQAEKDARAATAATLAILDDPRIRDAVWLDQALRGRPGSS